MDAPSNGNGTRKRRLLFLAAAVVLAGVAYGLYMFVHGRFYEETDDAYVAADLVQITSEVSGTVAAVHVDDTQHVTRGQILVELDPSDAQIASSSAEAELARTVREVRGVFSQAGALRAQIHESEIGLRAARADLARRESIAQGGAVAAEELAHARDQVAQLQAAVAARQESLASTEAQIEDTRIATHPAVLAAAARVKEASLALRRTRIVAPMDGTIARRGVQIGARIAQGSPLMAVVPLSNVWVEANFKEVQLADLRIDQPVELRADIYGRKVTYHGHVAGLGAGSGSAFALLPPQNASGNWIKVVQRVPVRIALDRKELEAHPLRVGLSMTATIDMHDTSGPLVNSRVRPEPQRNPGYEEGDALVNQRIAAIIASNAGTGLTSQL